MLPLLLLAVFGANEPLSAVDAPASSIATAASPQGREGKPLHALEAWLKLYEKGKIDFRSKENIANDSLATKFGLRGKNSIGDPTWAGDLDVILENIAALDDADAARALAGVAAIGLEQGKYTFAMAPYDVRSMGEKWLIKLRAAAAKEELARGARGEWKADRKTAEALRAAALRGLGLLGDPVYQPVVTAALADPSELVRIHAIDALAKFGDEASALALIGVVEREQAETVLTEAVRGLRDLYGRYLRDGAAKANPDAKPESDGKGRPDAKADPEPEPQAGADEPAADPAPKPAAPAPPAPPASARLAVRAAIAALGRTTWRADMVLVRLLDDFRSSEAVPALIAVLERFRDNPADVASGKLSGLLLHQVHELLVGMTGALIPATEPQKWRELWEKEKDNIKVTEKRAPQGTPHTVSAGFAGIPVQGTRVVFVLDLSRSMEWPMDDADAKSKGQRIARIDYAKRELLRAVGDLAPNAMFNLVTFNGDSEAEAWSKKLVDATPRNRERFKKYVDKLVPNGGTNLWSGMEKALEFKSLVYGNHYETNVDEVFVLSDGAPTVGDVTDPLEILRLVQECNRFACARINTVFISSATPPEYQRSEPRMAISPKELMRRMAEENGGQFRDL